MVWDQIFSIFIYILSNDNKQNYKRNYMSFIRFSINTVQAQQTHGPGQTRNGKTQIGFSGFHRTQVSLCVSSNTTRRINGVKSWSWELQSPMFSAQSNTCSTRIQRNHGFMVSDSVASYQSPRPLFLWYIEFNSLNPFFF